MLDNLVESRNDKRNERRGGFLLTTSVLVFSLFASGILWSLFAKDLGIGTDNLELSSMVAPVLPEVDPPKAEPVKEVKQTQSQKTEDNVIIRKENMASTQEPIPPREISTTPNTNLSRPQNAKYQIGDVDSNPKGDSNGSERVGRGGDGNGTESIGVKNQVAKIEDENEKEPPAFKKTVEPKVEKKMVSGGVLNGKAMSLPKPNYPPAAKAVRASGDVNVQVTIDEKGNVISASAVSGHALLRQVSEQAARSAKFSVTYLSNQPVKVTGIIVYKFAMQ